jgi:predicted metallo-beta-lactamase superfamily hydrolase
MSTVFREEILKVKTVTHKTYDTYTRSFQRGTTSCRNSDDNFEEKLLVFSECVEPVNKR